MRNKNYLKLYYVLLCVLFVFLFQKSSLNPGKWAWEHNIRWLYVFFVSFLASQILTPISIKLAFKFNILDFPDNIRKLHKSPIPRIGGLAIFGAIIISTLRNFNFSTELSGLIIGSSMFYLIGFIDDIKPISATARLIAQIVSALFVVYSGVTISIIPVGFPFEKIIEGTITVIWLIGIANSINFLDGVDGLAAGMSALCAGLFFVISIPTNQPHLMFLTIATVGACAGFLPYNWGPAKVYLGDSGATFLGFFIAGLAIMGSWENANPMIAISTPLLILGIPIFDTIYTTISRIKNGHVKSVKEWLEYTGRDHFHHRLMLLKLSPKRTVLFILMINLCIGLAALVIRNTGTIGSTILLFQTVVFFLIIVILMLLGREKIQSPSKK